MTTIVINTLLGLFFYLMLLIVYLRYFVRNEVDIMATIYNGLKTFNNGSIFVKIVTIIIVLYHSYNTGVLFSIIIQHRILPWLNKMLS